MNELEHEVRNVTRYVEAETDDETVTHAERMMTTKVLGKEHEVWDVRTDKHRWWVVTNMTNLYSQDDFQSADMCLTFHLGLMFRVAERSRVAIDEDAKEVVDTAWRRYEQAVAAFNSADEAEAFQAVGVRCREALIAVAGEIAKAIGEELTVTAPKAADFKGWATCLSETVGERRLRVYIRTLSESAWDIVVWLQHYRDAGPWDAELALDATAHPRHDCFHPAPSWPGRTG